MNDKADRDSVPVSDAQRDIRHYHQCARGCADAQTIDNTFSDYGYISSYTSI